ncbi:MAG: hypothetical protein HY720_11835 [Planctomycetes bacterium]|nr:hypothetical protein [Planctomycetota bacterium]
MNRTLVWAGWVAAALAGTACAQSVEIVGVTPQSGLAVIGDTVAVSYIASGVPDGAMGQVTLTLEGAAEPTVTTDPQVIQAGVRVDDSFRAPVAGTYELKVVVFVSEKTGIRILATAAEPYVIGPADLPARDAKKMLSEKMQQIIDILDTWLARAVLLPGGNPDAIRGRFEPLRPQRNERFERAARILEKNLTTAERLSVILETVFDFMNWVAEVLGPAIETVTIEIAKCEFVLRVSVEFTLFSPGGMDKELLRLQAFTSWETKHPPVKIDRFLAIEVVSPAPRMPRIFDGVIEIPTFTSGAGEGDTRGTLEIDRSFESDGRGRILSADATAIAMGRDSDRDGLCLRIVRAVEHFPSGK